MDKTNKILLIIFLILIAATSISLGYLLTNTNKKANNNINTTNMSNQTNNTSQQNITTQINRTKKTTNSNSGLITSQQAINIVKHSAPAPNCTFSAKLITSSNPPYYLVNVYDNNPQSPSFGWAIGGAKVNAKTGKIIFAMG